MIDMCFAARLPGELTSGSFRLLLTPLEELLHILCLSSGSAPSSVTRLTWASRSPGGSVLPRPRIVLFLQTFGTAQTCASLEILLSPPFSFANSPQNFLLLNKRRRRRPVPFAYFARHSICGPPCGRLEKRELDDLSFTAAR